MLRQGARGLMTPIAGSQDLGIDLSPVTGPLCRQGFLPQLLDLGEIARGLIRNG
mgnify:CR=1 FL=1